jgi:cytochrome c553
MHKTVIPTTLILAALLSTVPMVLAATGDNGRDDYQAFKCAQCHGDDAKTPAKTGTPSIAGLEPDYLVRKTKRMIAEVAHAEVAGPSCGEPMTEAQILSIAKWVSLQPR